MCRVGDANRGEGAPSEGDYLRIAKDAKGGYYMAVGNNAEGARGFAGRTENEVRELFNGYRDAIVQGRTKRAAEAEISARAAEARAKADAMNAPESFATKSQRRQADKIAANLEEEVRRAKYNLTEKERNVVDLSKDNKLSALVKNVHGSQRYAIIKEYILTELADQPIRLSDGKTAIVDKSDAQHIARNAGDKKTAEISQIKKIIENAVLTAEESSKKDTKFDYYWYYEAHVIYDGESIPVYVNVGRARNDASYHIYDITQKLRDTAHRVNDVERPVGNALENDIPTNSIPQNSDLSTPKSLEELRDQINAGSGRIAENRYTQAQTDAARRAVKDFDMLDADTKAKILRWIESTEGKGVDADVVSAVASIMRIREGLQVIYADTKEGVAGFHDEIKKADRNLIVLSSKNDLDLLRETIAHELGHEVENVEGFEEIKKAALKATKEADLKEWEELYKKRFPDMSPKELENEVAMKALGRRLATPQFLNRYANRSTLRRLIDAGKQLIKYLRADEAGKLAIRETNKLIEMMDKAIMGANVQGEGGDAGKKYALQSKIDPTKLDPRTVTRDDVLEMLKNAEKGEYDENTYIPVRISTPAIVIQRAKEKLNEVIPNYPLIMSVKKVIGAIERKGVNDDGLPNRLEPEEIVRVVEATSDPLYVVYEPANEEHTEPRYVEVVKFDLKKGRKAFAVLELVGEKKSSIHINGYEGGNYNVFVTVYPPHEFKLKELLNNENNVVIYEKKKDFSQGTSNITVSSVLNDPSFFDNSIYQKTSVVNTSEKNILSDEDQALLFDEEFYNQFQYESRDVITDTIDELEMLKESEDFKELTDDEAHDVNAKLKALKNGYRSLYDYYVGTAKKNLLDDYDKRGQNSKTYRLLKEKQKGVNKREKLTADISGATDLQKAQFDIIQRTNPMWDDYHTGIRSPKDIKTFAETIDDEDSFTWGDFSRADAREALKHGTVRVYSSYAIKNGVFVSTSYKQALGYSGNDSTKVHSKTVALNDVAWINGDEGQYAKVSNTNKKSYNLTESEAERAAQDAAEVEALLNAEVKHLNTQREFDQNVTQHLKYNLTEDDITRKTSEETEIAKDAKKG